MCAAVVRANFCCERASTHSPGTPEVLKYPAGFPQAKCLSFSPSLRALATARGPRRALPRAGLGPPGAPRQGQRGRQSRPAAGCSRRNLGRPGIASRAGGRHLRPGPGKGRPGAGRRRPGCRLGHASPEAAPRGARPRLGKLGGPPGPPPAPPLTEEALHDPERLAEPVLPAGHLADGPGPTRPGVQRRGSSSGGPAAPRPRPPTQGEPRGAGRPASGNGGCGGGGGRGAAGDRQAARAGPQPPLRTMAGNRRRRPRCLRPGWSSRGRGGGSAPRGPAGGEEGRAVPPGAGQAGAGPRRHLGDGHEGGRAGLAQAAARGAGRRGPRGRVAVWYGVRA